MFSIHELGVSHGGRTLFCDATLVFNAGSRYGIVGANGAGKSTLLRVMAGQEESTEGTVSIPRNKRVGVLGQDHFRYDQVPVLHVVMMGLPELWAAMIEKEAMLQRAAEEPESFDVERFGDLEETIMSLDGYSLEARAADILEGLNIPASKHHQPLSTLSGGYKLRVLLAQTLAANPDILFLDEPTNHLDIISIAWLERFLKDHKGVVVVVSHDHTFLNTACTHIIDVDYERVTLYPGNYDYFVRAKVELRDRKEQEIAKVEATIAGHEEFVRRFKATASKARQAQSRMKQIERFEVEELPRSSRIYPNFRFTAERDTGKVVLEAEGISKAFNGRSVLKNVDFRIQRGERVAIVGPNGVGKSTLLKILMGELEADAGRFEWGHAAWPGYFSQDHGDLKGAAEASLLDWLWNQFPDKSTGFIRGKLAEVLFVKDDVDKKVGNLSGGEVARLVFCRLGALAPTVLVLDEPTNHLDLEGITSLADGLASYENAMLFVSHDRWFVSRLATRVLALSEDGLEDYAGGYEEWLRATQSTDHLDRQAVVEDDRRQKRTQNKR